MENRFKIARKSKKMTVAEVIKHIGVSQPALTSWESGKSAPSLEKVMRLAELYEVSIDYLLGRSSIEDIPEDVVIAKELLPILDNKPVWLENIGWALVDAQRRTFIRAHGQEIPFDAVQRIYAKPDFFNSAAPTIDTPIDAPDLIPGLEILLEPISADEVLREQLRGDYKLHDGYAENSVGNRFTFNTYGIHWLAFPKK